MNIISLARIVDEMLDRETLSLVLGIMLIAVAIVLNSLQLITTESMIALISVGLSIVLGGRVGANNPGRILARALRVGRSLEPVIAREGDKIVVYCARDSIPRSFDKLMRKYAKRLGLELEYRVHGGVRFV